jgi:hypothetical protein
MNTYNFLPNEKLDDFLSNYPFRTFQKHVPLFGSPLSKLGGI